MKSLQLCSLTLFSLLLLLVGWAADSDARPFRIAKLPGGGPNFGCAACHVNPAGGGEKNAFGLDYEAIALAAGDVYTDELGQKDSDGDGFSNDDEFNADPPTEPWNSDSHPPVVQVSVGRIGKMFAVWARLKLEPIGLGRHSQPTSKDSVPAIGAYFKRIRQPVRREKPAEVGENPVVTKNRVVPIRNSAAKDVKENSKAGTKSRAANK